MCPAKARLHRISIVPPWCMISRRSPVSAFRADGESGSSAAARRW
jgi:hypothetical protein